MWGGGIARVTNQAHSASDTLLPCPPPPPHTHYCSAQVVSGPSWGRWVPSGLFPLLCPPSHTLGRGELASPGDPVMTACLALPLPLQCPCCQLPGSHLCCLTISSIAFKSAPSPPRPPCHGFPFCVLSVSPSSPGRFSRGARHSGEVVLGWRGKCKHGGRCGGSPSLPL